MSPLKVIPVTLAVAALSSVALLSGAPVVHEALQGPDVARIGVPGTDLPMDPGHRTHALGGGVRPEQPAPTLSSPQLPATRHPEWSPVLNTDPALAFLTPSQRAVALAPPVSPPAPAQPGPTATATSTPTATTATQTPAPAPVSPPATGPVTPPPATQPTPQPAPADPAAAVQQWAQQRQLPPGTTLVPLASSDDASATYQQVVGGVPVLGAQVHACLDETGAVTVSGTVSTALGAMPAEQIDASVAQQAALRYLTLNSPAPSGSAQDQWLGIDTQRWWYDPALDGAAVEQASSPQPLALQEQGQPVVVQDSRQPQATPTPPPADGEQARLVYLVVATRTSSEQPTSVRQFVLVDAGSANVVRSSVAQLPPPEPDPTPTDPTPTDPTPTDPVGPAPDPQPVGPGVVTIPQVQPQPSQPQPTSDPFPIPVVTPAPEPDPLPSLPRSEPNEQPMPEPQVTPGPSASQHPALPGTSQPIELADVPLGVPTPAREEHEAY